VGEPPDNLEWGRLKADVRRAASCVDLYGRLHPDPAGRVRDGGTVRCIAPDHDDSDPSMSLHADGFKCHACGTSGDVFDLWALADGRQSDGEDFKRTLLELADDQGFSLDQYAHNGASVDVETPPPSARRAQTTENTATSPTLEASDARRDVLERVWELVEQTGLTEAAEDWLRSRSIPPPVAQAYGCRDWHPTMGAIFERLRDFDADELHRAGMVNDDGDAWWPLRSYLADDQEPTRGLAVPVWHPDYPDAPVAYRWRVYEPGEDFPPKSFQQASGPGKFREPPLGLWEPAPVYQIMLEAPWLDEYVDTETARRWLKDEQFRPVGDYPGEFAVVLCEGETDWLSVAAAALELEDAPRIVPVGVTAKTRAIADTTLDALAEADHVHVALDGKADDETADWYARCEEIVNGLVARDGPGAEARFTFATYPESRDLNDLRGDGTLADRLRDWLGSA